MGPARLRLLAAEDFEIAAVEAMAAGAPVHPLGTGRTLLDSVR